jgi:ABC-type phosphate transport system substrate-binding protein
MRSIIDRFAKALALPLLALLAAWIAQPVQAGDFAVIVNKDNTSTIDKITVVRIYSGEMKRWHDGTPVAAVDLPEENPVRASFSSQVLGKTVSNVKALWAQLIFSGQALPPKQAATDEDVKKLVSANKGAIGYVKTAAVDGTVKAVLN